MSKFMYNGKPYGGSTNYASSVACTDAEGNESTVQAEINELNVNKLSISNINYSNPTITLQYTESSDTKDATYTATTNCMVVGYGKGGNSDNMVVVIDGVTVAYLGYVYKLGTTEQIGQHYAPFTYFLSKGSNIRIYGGAVLMARIYNLD